MHRERENIVQKALRFKMPQTDTRVLSPFVLGAARKLGEFRSYLQPSEIPTPRADLLGERGVVVRPVFTGICGTDKAFADGSIHRDTHRYIPGLDPNDISLFIHAQRALIASIQSVGKTFHRKQGEEGEGEENGRVIREFTPGHELIVADKKGKLYTVYPVLDCEAVYANDRSQYCECCKDGDTNSCQNRESGPVRGLAVGMGAVTERKEELHGGFTDGPIVVFDNQLVEIPNGIDPKLFVMIDVLSCAIHGIDEAAKRGAFDKQNAQILVVSFGPMGASAVLHLNHLGFKDVVVTTRDTSQSDLVKSLNFEPIQTDGDEIGHLANAIGAKVNYYGNDAFEILGGKGGFDVVIDGVGIHMSQELTKPRGVLVQLGLPEESRGPVRDLTKITTMWSDRGDVERAKSEIIDLPEQIRDHLVFVHDASVDFEGAFDAAFHPKDRTYIKHAVGFVNTNQV